MNKERIKTIIIVVLVLVAGYQKLMRSSAEASRDIETKRSVDLEWAVNGTARCLDAIEYNPLFPLKQSVSECREMLNPSAECADQKSSVACQSAE